MIISSITFLPITILGYELFLDLIQHSTCEISIIFYCNCQLGVTPTLEICINYLGSVLINNNILYSV